MQEPKDKPRDRAYCYHDRDHSNSNKVVKVLNRVTGYVTDPIGVSEIRVVDEEVDQLSSPLTTARAVEIGTDLRDAYGHVDQWSRFFSDRIEADIDRASVVSRIFALVN